MGEAKRRRPSREGRLLLASRCTYCPGQPTGWDHMPPISMFEGRHRPEGFEFAACSACNVGTRTCDALASMLAHVSPLNAMDHWQTTSSLRLFKSVGRLNPDLAIEISRNSPNSRTWIARPSGLQQEAVSVSLNGPLVRPHMRVFTAKLAMGLYREHIGEPLPVKGATFTRHFLNAGLSQEEADATLSILPGFASLQQGQWTVQDQFSYRYNTDGRTIVGSMVRFHGNLHVIAFATSTPEYFGATLESSGLSVLRPGQFGALLSRSGS